MTAITISNRTNQTFSDINKIAHTISTTEYLLEVEKQVAIIEGGVNAVAKKSFRSARFSLIKNILSAGGNVLSFQSKQAWENDEIIYKRKNIKIIYTENYSQDEWENVLQDKNISLVYVPTINQENLSIQDYGYIIQKAHQINVPVVFDNTHGGLGYIYAPLKDGADFVLTDLSSSEIFQKHLIHSFIVEGSNGILHSNTDKILGRTVLDNQKYNRVLNTKSTYFPAEREDHIEKTIKKEAIKKGDYSRTANYVSRWLNNQEEIMEITYAGLKSSESHIHAELYFKGGYGNIFKFSLWDNEYSYSLLRGFFRSGKFKGINIEVNTNTKEFFVEIETENYMNVLQYFQKVFTILKQNVEFRQNLIK
ncbi:PLP-dependent transferase [Cytophaga aurantiaca]|uniref:PLP-dependent transferase n=1 Tax=Cytophaga aurantiaca TaxID=29530 RepID=UPI00037702C2|nr:PLP-dependent transferase [Cytophaga aurantiaca]